MEESLKEVEIDRATWLTGEVVRKEHICSSLRDPFTGKKCCLGFVAKKEGFTDKEINEIPDFFGLASKSREKAKRVNAMFPGLYPTREIELASQIQVNMDEVTKVNDAEYYNSRLSVDNERKDRERQVTRALAKIGYKPVFTGEYPTYRS